MSDYRGSTTPIDVKDLWSTPQWFFNAIDSEFDFGLDAAASATNHKVDHYLTEQENALLVDWVEYIRPDSSAVWVNPPYSDIGPWIEKAKTEEGNGLGVVLLVPHTPDAAWWPRDAAEIRVYCGYSNPSGRNMSGRIQFMRSDTGEVVRGNPKGSCIIIYNPNAISRMQTIYVGIETLRS